MLCSCAHVVMCHVCVTPCICKKKRASLLSCSSIFLLLRRGAPRTKRSSFRKRDTRLFVSQSEFKHLSNSNGSRFPRRSTRRTVGHGRSRVDRAPYRVFKRRGLRCVDAGFAMGDGRTRVSMRDARGAWTRIGARRVRGASARAARPRVGAATRHCRQTRCRAARQLATLSFS